MDAVLDSFEPGQGCDVLCFAAHPDDVEMAMGGTVSEAMDGPDLDVIDAGDVAPVAKPKPRKQSKPNTDAQAQAGALSALSNLGYSPSDAASAVAEAAAAEPGQGEAALIKAALKLLAPKN